MPWPGVTVFEATHGNETWAARCFVLSPKRTVRLQLFAGGAWRWSVNGPNGVLIARFASSPAGFSVTGGVWRWSVSGPNGVLITFPCGAFRLSPWPVLSPSVLEQPETANPSAAATTINTPTHLSIFKGNPHSPDQTIKPDLRDSGQGRKLQFV